MKRNNKKNCDDPSKINWCVDESNMSNSTSLEYEGEKVLV